MNYNEQNEINKTFFETFKQNLNGQDPTTDLLKAFLKNQMLIEYETNTKIQSDIKDFLKSDLIKSLIENELKEESKINEFYKSIYKMFPNPHIQKWDSFINSIISFDDSKDYHSRIFSRRFPIGTISYIGARPGRGKTTALVNIALDALEQNKPVVYVTAEETTKQILTRFILCETYKNNSGDIWTVSPERKPRTEFFNYLKDSNKQDSDPKLFEETSNKIFNSQYFEKSTNTIKDYIEHKKLTVFEAYGATWNELKDFLEEQEAGSVILIDYIQHLKTPSQFATQTRQIQIQEVSHQLADLSGVHGLILISGAQFKRPDDKKGDLEKTDSFSEDSFREAGDIEQDGHILIGIGKAIEKDYDGKTYDTLFYSCMKDREATPDNGKCWRIKKDMAFSFLQGEKNDKGENLEYIRPEKPSKKETPATNKKNDAMKNFNYGGK